MFDKTYVVRDRVEHVPFTKEVYEYRAPTDQSIEILNEMQDKVMKNMMGQLRLSGSTEITEVVASIQYQPWKLETAMFYKFKINGYSQFGCVACPQGLYKYTQDNVEMITKLLIEDMSSKIAEFLCDHFVRASLINEGKEVKFDV